MLREDDAFLRRLFDVFITEVRQRAEDGPIKIYDEGVLPGGETVWESCVEHQDNLREITKQMEEKAEKERQAQLTQNQKWYEEKRREYIYKEKERKIREEEDEVWKEIEEKNRRREEEATEPEWKTAKERYAPAPKSQAAQTRP